MNMKTENMKASTSLEVDHICVKVENMDDLENGVTIKMEEVIKETKHNIAEEDSVEKLTRNGLAHKMDKNENDATIAELNATVKDLIKNESCEENATETDNKPKRGRKPKSLLAETPPKLTGLAADRKLRDRKGYKQYSDDWVLGEEEIEGQRSFHLEEKITTDRFSQQFVREMQGPELTIEYVQKNGFDTPLLFRDKAGLGIQVPSADFSVNDVRVCVGSRRVVDVMDVGTQKNMVMSMKDWQKYYENPQKTDLYNVISLEFSHTKLENYVQSPAFVRSVDWVDCAWPRMLKEAQKESTNSVDDMMYPKVQKYCLMSVKGCYTDFHVDFGGTSVWYHILKGSKIFWLIPPTKENLAKYEKWVLSGKQSDIFFGDMVNECGRVTLPASSTFLIPSGWIHAVYTPADSLVFGGNFLHSFGIENQLAIAQIEETTHVPQKFRYPFFTEILWFVLERYVHMLMGRSHLTTTDDESPHNIGDTHLTQWEVNGIKEIVFYLHSLPASKKSVPAMIRDPVELIKDVRQLVAEHANDAPDLAVNGKLSIGVELDTLQNRIMKMKNFNPKRKMHQVGGKEKAQYDKGLPRRRRTRCKRCEPCCRNDCGECSFCGDMVKFGGPGRMKQSCIMRQCIQPDLPASSTCIICAQNGWGGVKKVTTDTPSSLMECCICYEIVHPDCIATLDLGYEGVVNEDLPNSWECPKCCKQGKNVDYTPRHFKAREKSIHVRTMLTTQEAGESSAQSDEEMPTKKTKLTTEESPPKL